jgi:type II secretion system protein G
VIGFPHEAASAQYSWARVSLERFHKALEEYRLDCGAYPDARVGLRALVTNPGINGWNGPYYKESLRDPWRRPYLYEMSGDVAVVRSLGADGKPGRDLLDGELSSQDPDAPIHESSFHAAQRLFDFWLAPWL